MTLNQDSPNDHFNFNNYVTEAEGKILFSGNILKINPVLKAEHRLVTVSTHFIKNLGEPNAIIKNLSKDESNKRKFIRSVFHKPKRTIPIHGLIAISITSQSTELVVHVKEEYSYHFDCKTEREALIAAISIAFKLNTNRDLPVLHSDRSRLHKLVLTNKRIKAYSSKAVFSNLAFMYFVEEKIKSEDNHENKFVIEKYRSDSKIEHLNKSQYKTIKSILEIEKSIVGKEQYFLKFFEIKKINKRLKHQKRMLFFTDDCIFTCKENSTDYRKLILAEVKSVILSLFTSEVILSYPDDYDLYILVVEKVDFLKLLFYLNPQIEFYFTSKVNLKKLVMTKDNTEGYGYDYETHFWSVKEYIETLAEISYETSEQKDKEEEESSPVVKSTNADIEPGKYSFEDLKDVDNLPEDVDPKYRELKLNSKEFLERFGISATEFAILPQVERNILKRRAGF